MPSAIENQSLTSSFLIGNNNNNNNNNNKNKLNFLVVDDSQLNRKLVGKAIQFLR